MLKPELVIMAAGLGSRYGGLKQITPVDEYGQFIIDYSVYDAILAGFEKVIFIIKPENEADFRSAIAKRLEGHIDVHFAYQTLDILPAGFTPPPRREKPWGTAHAALCAKDKISGPVAVINADDFYGRGAYIRLYEFLTRPRAYNEHAMVGYRVENTLTENGSVARGVCQVDENGYLTQVVEHTKIYKRPGGAEYTEDGKNYVFLPGNTIVSMNFWGFQPSIMREIEERFSVYLRENLPVNPLKCEYFLPLIPNQLIEEGAATFTVLDCDCLWHGVTYKEDMPMLKKAIAELEEKGVYPGNLWT
ncbi:MAG: sugar phosphate nucleotidyltransferase [Clostridia bacterium]|nr:sugar phosphate nucleotidyltransferase [Clostridia bacterium]